MPDSSPVRGTPGVQVSIFDPVTGDTEKVDLSEAGYIVLVDDGTHHIAAHQFFPTTGTAQFTIKRGKDTHD